MYLDQIFRYLKYGVLIDFLFLTWNTGYLAIRVFDPCVAYHHLFPDELFSANLFGFVFLAITPIGSLVVESLFCRHLCPMGGFIGIISEAGLDVGEVRELVLMYLAETGGAVGTESGSCSE